jgi:hypothetical protein
MSVSFSEQDKLTLRTAAYGAVALLPAAGATDGSPHKIAADGSIALACATGPVGHMFAERGEPSRTMAEMNRRIVAALDADSAAPGVIAADNGEVAA